MCYKSSLPKGKHYTFFSRMVYVHTRAQTHTHTYTQTLSRKKKDQSGNTDGKPAFIIECIVGLSPDGYI